MRREVRLWGVPTGLCLDARGDLGMHASAVEVDGRALVFVAPGRFGKTTLAAAFHADGHRILAEDMTCVTLTPEPSVLPGPAVLRLRPDVYERLDVADTTVLDRDDERIHLGIDDARRGDGRPVPLAAIVVLRRGTPDIQLYRVLAERFLPEVAAVAWLLPGESDRLRTFDRCVSLVSQVPLWLLDRPLTFDELKAVIDQLIDRCLA